MAHLPTNDLMLSRCFCYFRFLYFYLELFFCRRISYVLVISGCYNNNKIPWTGDLNSTNVFLTILEAKGQVMVADLQFTVRSTWFRVKGYPSCLLMTQDEDSMILTNHFPKFLPTDNTILHGKKKSLCFPYGFVDLRY